MKEKVGIGVITFNREKQIDKVLSAIGESVADVFVLVNDTLNGYNVKYPEKYHIIQHEENKGVCISKNDALKYLMDNGCDHLFLIEDDMLIKDNSVFQKYIDTSKRTGIKHFNYAFHGPANMLNGKPNPKFGVEYDENIKISINKHCVGAIEYFRREVIETVGYMDENYINAWEHPAHTYEIIKNDFHPPFWNFVDLYDSYNYIDEIGNVNDNSVIRKNQEHNDNIKKGREYFFKRNGIDILSIPDVSQQTVYSFLERKEKEAKEEIEKNKKAEFFDMSDFSFLFPIKLDNEERIDNLNSVISFYRKYCYNLKFIIIENDIEQKLSKDKLNFTDDDKLLFFKSEDGAFNKCKCYNTGTIFSNRKYVVATDVDVIVDPKNIFKSKQYINNNIFVKPYSGISFYMKDNSSKKFKENDYDFNYLKSIIPHKSNFRVSFFDNNLEVGNLKSPGGCVIFNRSMFLSNGGYNPNFTNWGYEDNEIIIRMEKLGNRLITMNNEYSFLWHLYHKSVNKNTHDFYKRNEEESRKINNMNKEQILEYIKTFK